MQGLRRQGHWFARLVAAVLLLAALAPALSRGLAYAEGRIAPWSVLCSATNPGAMGQPDGSGSDDGLAAAHLLQHCALCAQLGDTPALPIGATADVFLVPALAQAMPPLWRHAPQPLHAWASVRSRAPPPIA